MREIIVIQCAHGKRDLEPWHYDGREIKFVANPTKCKEPGPNVCYYRPDDRIPGITMSCREILNQYNESREEIPGFFQSTSFKKAYELYMNPIYKDLVSEFKEDCVFILSAGWGLVRSDYLLPSYNITFSRSARVCNKRTEDDFSWCDYSQMENMALGKEDKIYFFGTSAYRPLYYHLTCKVAGTKKVYYCGTNKPEEATEYEGQGYKYEWYRNKPFQNWPYVCAKERLLK